MITEIFAAIGAVSNSLNIKDKLFNMKHRTANLEPLRTKYCSIFLEHSFPRGDFGSLHKHSLELTLCKLDDFTIPIRSLDWVIWGSSLEELKPLDFKIPTLWSLPSQACLMSLDVNSVLERRLDDRNWSGTELRKTVKSMHLQCVYADGFRQKLPAPDTLQLALFNKYCKSKRFASWHEYRILYT